jgi:flagellar hook-length control protein FliK
VTAVLQCDSPSVRAWIETHQAELRRALEEQGLSLDTLTVDPEGHPQHQQEQSAQRDHQPRNWRRGEPGQFEALL